MKMMQQLTIDTKNYRHKKYIPQTQHFGNPFKGGILSSVREKKNAFLKTYLKFKFNTCQESKAMMNYSQLKHDLSILGTF